MDLHHKSRWVFSGVVNGKPVAAEYAVQWENPLAPVNDSVLVHCVMNAHQLRAARQDPRLMVLGSIHCGEKIPDQVADHHKPAGVKRGDQLPAMLAALALIHPAFEPED